MKKRIVKLSLYFIMLPFVIVLGILFLIAIPIAILIAPDRVSILGQE